MNIGFIGLGLMGGRMAAHLIDPEHRLAVFNRTREKADPLLEKGALRAESPAALARDSEIVFTMLSTPEAVFEIAAGQSGFLTAMAPESLWVDCSTVNPSFSRSMARVAEEQGVRFLDAPVAGTIGPAGAGELAFLVGGADEDLARCRRLLFKMGKTVVHTGAVGTGTALKMLFNLMLGTAMAAASEALVLGEAMGLSREILHQTLLASPVSAPFLAVKREKLASGDFSPEFPLKWMGKDLQLATLTGHETGVSLPMAGAAKEIFALAGRQGFADLDFSALFAFLAKDSET